VNKRLKGSGILIVILSAITFSIYASSTYVEKEHFDILQKKYEVNIKKYYEKDLNNIDSVYEELCVINLNK